jgi:AraC-like DNA-binding protein
VAARVADRWSMRRATSLDDYVANWRDAYVVAKDFCAFHTSPSLFGLVVWGRPGLDQARAIVQSRGPELADDGPHHVILDYRLVEVVDPDAFRSLAEFVATNRDRLTRVTAKVALVKPSDPFAGATVAGFYSVVAPPYPSKLCDTIEEAEAWLGVPTLAHIAHAHDASAAGRPTTSSLGQLLDREPTLNIDDAASQLALTGRTLQRRLAAEDTTFVAEARKAKVRRAKHLLATTDDKVGDIARSVGSASVQHFTELFREETGTTPAAWRSSRRKPD